MASKYPSRYGIAKGPEAQHEPGSRGRVLANRLGICRKGDMDKAEYDLFLMVQKKYLSRISNDTRFTARLLCQMHRDWLGEIYGWAGKYRSVELEKGDFRWPPARFVSTNMEAFEKGLLRKYTPCLKAPLPKIARQIAEVHAELLLIHPFREGNGRLARWLADLMALQAGLPMPSYGFTGRGSKARKENYLEAVKRGYLGDYEALASVFLEAIERRLRGTR